MKHPYEGIVVALGSLHGKELVIEPPLRHTFSLSVVPVAFDTDAYGAFTGETPRQGTMLDAARAKAHHALELLGVPYGIASEGSFSPHPELPWLIVDRELLLFIDRERHLEISALVATTDVRADHHEVQTLSEALEAARACGMPEYGVTLRYKNEPTWIAKGLRDDDAVTLAFTRLHEDRPQIPLVLETDLRAHMNPARQRAIAQAAEQLAENLVRLCPRCDKPGLSLMARLPGAACSRCGRPTNLPGSERFRCSDAGCRYEETRPLNAQADPGHCSFCNP